MLFMKTPIQERFSAAAQAVSHKAETVHDKVGDIGCAIRRRVTEPIAEAWDKVPDPAQFLILSGLIAVGAPVVLITAAASLAFQENPLQVIGDMMPQSNGADVVVAPAPTPTPSPIIDAPQYPELFHAMNNAATTGTNWVTAASIIAGVGIPVCGFLYFYATNRDFREYANDIAHTIGEGVGAAVKNVTRRNPFS